MSSIGQQTEALERLKGILQGDTVWTVCGGPTGRRQAPLQLPTKFQGEQTDKHVAAGPGVLADKDGAHLQQARLQPADVLFDLRQVLIAIMGGLRIEELRRDIGLQDKTASQLQALLMSNRIRSIYSSL